MNRGSTGMNRGSTQDNQDEPGTTGYNRKSIKMLNTSGMNLESPGRTGNDRHGTRNNWDGTTPEELRQFPGCHWWCPGGARVNDGRGNRLCRVVDLIGFTGAAPGNSRAKCPKTLTLDLNLELIQDFITRKYFDHLSRRLSNKMLDTRVFTR
ncbi:hypothetical protein DPMN_112565 [Dreissena polymorpha]|uniref:Uncharacterized protein n=1 Tax=Dreissena polymorpha TaxID=45954 RepID=A0A9D4KHB4_DREPO|nr:hypothetical protein DPMN_112565 [Dreissena polymorpha]